MFYVKTVERIEGGSACVQHSYFNFYHDAPCACVNHGQWRYRWGQESVESQNEKAMRCFETDIHIGLAIFHGTTPACVNSLLNLTAA